MRCSVSDMQPFAKAYQKIPGPDLLVLHCGKMRKSLRVQITLLWVGLT